MAVEPENKEAYLPIGSGLKESAISRKMINVGGKILNVYQCSPTEFKFWFRLVLDHLIQYEQSLKTSKRVGSHTSLGKGLLKETWTHRVCDEYERFYLLSELSSIPAWKACQYPIFYVLPSEEIAS